MDTFPKQSNRELIAAWRNRAVELDALALALMAEGDIQGSDDCANAAADYRSDADNLDYFGGRLPDEDF